MKCLSALVRISKRKQKNMKNTFERRLISVKQPCLHALFKEEEVYMHLSTRTSRNRGNFPLISPGTTSWTLTGAWLEHPISPSLSPLVWCFVLFCCNSGRWFVYDIVKGRSLMFALRFIFTQVSPNDRFCFPGCKRIILRICLFIFYVATAMAQSHLSKVVKWPTHQGHVWIFHSSSLNHRSSNLLIT